MSFLTRFETAIDDGLLALPDGPVSLLRPSPDFDPAVFQRPVQISHTFFPDVAVWRTQGFEVTQSAKEAATAIVFLPRSKALARSLIAEASRVADFIIVDGQKTDGADSLYKACRKLVGDMPCLTKAHGRMFWMNADAAFEDWAAPPPAVGSEGFFTTAGVFSDGAVDKGSALLANALPQKLAGRVADLGAGWGYLSKAVLIRDGVEGVDLVEAEALALDCARLNLPDEPRATFVWDDATAFGTAESYDHIVMNPPFHTGRDASPELGRAFIASAARLLRPKGSLWMVANRHLPYEAALDASFAKVTPLDGTPGFKLFEVSRPRR